MNKQKGFTLIELMVVIGIIAILSAIGIPGYQNYLRKAALTDMLQTFLPYRTAVELCAIERGGITGCNAGSNGIAETQTTRYIRAMDVSSGIVTLNGQDSLSGLTAIFTPQWSDASGVTGWTRNCNAESASPLKQACESVFRFNESAPGAEE
ncbi:Pilin [Cedecea lapagei]|uniref:Pilin n=1 Tax=Cedecea lapagei TaxID=158823 RepID=A0A3S4JDZ8_9ENTR|nr:prepilin peptidase-dependent pilin [Cedecea lapagei]VEC00778.1 Pilin [Cedecea lapagei]